VIARGRATRRIRGRNAVGKVRFGCRKLRGLLMLQHRYREAAKEKLIMAEKRPSRWVRVKKNVRTRLVSGMLLLVPFGVTLLVMRWLFRWMAGFLHGPVASLVFGLTRHPAIKSVPPTFVSVVVSVLSIIILLVLLYLVGAIGHFVTGKRLISAGETLVLRIPLMRTIYAATKQVVRAISLPDRAAFKSVVLVEFPRPGFKAVGFLTGHIHDSAGRKFCKVFEIVPVEEVMVTSMSTEDAFKMVISGGILSPDVIAPAPPRQAAGNSSQGQDDSDGEERS